MSLPAVAIWKYNWKPTPDSTEYKLTHFYLQPQDWANMNDEDDDPEDFPPVINQSNNAINSSSKRVFYNNNSSNSNSSLVRRLNNMFSLDRHNSNNNRWMGFGIGFGCGMVVGVLGIFLYIHRRMLYPAAIAPTSTPTSTALPPARK